MKGQAMGTARRAVFVLLAAVLILGNTGCKEDEPGFRTWTLTGTVEEIDLAGSRVQISFYSDKQQRNISAEAAITPDTEVIINGVAAKLTDVKVGERAEGEAIVTRKDGKRHIAIKRVRIERAAPMNPAKPPPPPAPSASTEDADAE